MGGLWHLWQLWPMIAGVGAAVAVAVGIGQMIVAALFVYHDNQHATVAIRKNLTQAFKIWLTSDRKGRSKISSAS